MRLGRRAHEQLINAYSDGYIVNRIMCQSHVRSSLRPSEEPSDVLPVISPAIFFASLSAIFENACKRGIIIFIVPAPREEPKYSQ